MLKKKKKSLEKCLVTMKKHYEGPSEQPPCATDARKQQLRFRQTVGLVCDAITPGSLLCSFWAQWSPTGFSAKQS